MNNVKKNLFPDDLFLISWHPYFWFCLLAFSVYAQVLTFSEYTHYDDHYLIVDSYKYIDDLSDIGHAFFEDVSHQAQGGNLYRPLLTVSFILSAKISGMTPFGFHFIDILLHCASCCLLFITLQRFGFKRSASFIGSILFCVHPAFTQAIAWIPGRNDSLLTVFILSCFITYLKFLSTNSLKWFFIHILFFILALFTKETTVLFPFLALLYSILKDRKKVVFNKAAVLIAGWGIIIFNWIIIRHVAQVASFIGYIPAITIISSKFYITLFYLGNIFSPFCLAFAPVPKDINLAYGIISACLLVILVTFSTRKNWPIILFGLSWFIFFLIPTFLVSSPDKFFEHRIYLPSIGILIILLSLSFHKKIQFPKRFLYVIFIIIIAAFGWTSIVHSKNFKDFATLSQYDASTSPNDKRPYRIITRMIIPETLQQEIKSAGICLDSLHLNPELLSKEKLWQIINDLEEKLSQGNSELYHSLAIAYFARGYHLKSEENFLLAGINDKQNPIIHYNLGVLYYDAYKDKRAEEEWLKTIQLDPSMGNAYLNLTYLYYKLGQFENANKYCQKAILLGMPVPPLLEKEIKDRIPKH